MVLKNNFRFSVEILVLSFFLQGCKMTKEINENYLIVSKIVEIQNHINPDDLVLDITFEYAESAWGFESIQAKSLANSIELKGKLKFRGNGIFHYKLAIPEEIDIVKCYNKILWIRMVE